MDLFSESAAKRAPLADRMRARTLEEFIGQKHLLGKGKLLRRAIEADHVQSSIFFGPPGCGKTTLANVIANVTGSAFVKLNAVSAGVKDVREVIEQAETRLKLYGQRTLLLLDECHRWNKAQSDSILPALEQGILTFVGSTTENPMIAMTGAMVSRCRVYAFAPLSLEDIRTALERAIADTARGLGDIRLRVDEDAFDYWCAMAGGDARNALNALELAALTTPPDKDGVKHITRETAVDSMQQKVLLCDEEHYYNMLSAFCKSLRGSDADAALAWFARLNYAGVDPRIIVRRMIAHASEDIGLANPQAMVQAVTAGQALEFIGMPEARLSIAQAIIYICESAKSNAVVTAIDEAMTDAENLAGEPVPIHLRDTSYAGAKKLGHGAGYKYPHDYPGHYCRQDYAPPSVKGKAYYRPSGEGQEAKIGENRLRRMKTQNIREE